MNVPGQCVLAASLAMVLGAAAVVSAADTIELESPRGGWRDSSWDRANTDRAVYPAPLSDHGLYRAAAFIRGRIAEAGPKHSTLIVNGNPLNLATDLGIFARPWAFGPGPNSVEVRSADGRARKRVQFYETYTGAAPARLRIILGWDARRTDVDLHVITPDGGHAYYAQPVLPSGGGIDVDDMDGGPEIFSMAAPPRGNYLVYVNYFGQGRPETQVVVIATVTVITEENTVHEKRETLLVPLRRPGDLVLARTVRY